ncbi:Zn-dependent protease with chaperone function [Candidatus Electronema aureum]
MISSNLLYFLAVIFALSVSAAPKEPWLAPWLALPLFGLTLLIFRRIAGREFKAAFHRGGASTYFAAESRLSLLAALFFVGAVFALDLKYYLQPLSLGGTLPVLENVGGLLLFFFFLVLIWLQGHPFYQMLFGRGTTAARFAATNIRVNLPIVLPWLTLSLTFDLLRQLPFPGLQQTLASSWGELIFFLIAVIFLALLFPPLISRLWNCTPLPQGPQRSIIEIFFRRQNFSAVILSWPLLEGRALNAAVMGIAPRFRYLLLTPALLALLDQEELESVLAHEIGHVKKYHLLLYLFLLLGFGLFTEALAGPLLGLLCGSSWFWRFLLWSGLTADKMAEHLTAAVMFVLMLLYFRFLFGYFIRNFERQADLHAFQVQKSTFPLIRAFEKIAALTGNIRNQKNWHHFGIGERIDFLAQCECRPGLAQQHERKVYTSLAVYFTLIALAVWLLPVPDSEALQHRAKMQYASALIEQKLQTAPNSGNLLRLRADLLLEKGEEREARAAYETALRAEPDSAETANNLAWLLLTAKDKSLRNPDRALKLASAAVSLEEKGHILDTLAVALWTQGRIEEAVRTELRAAQINPENKPYYQAQAEKFTAGP